jgi:hypothetical protein
MYVKVCVGSYSLSTARIENFVELEEPVKVTTCPTLLPTLPCLAH